MLSTQLNALLTLDVSIPEATARGAEAPEA